MLVSLLVSNRFSGKFGGKTTHGPRRKRLDFPGNPDQEFVMEFLPTAVLAALKVPCRWFGNSSDVNKDWTCKDKDKDKDLNLVLKESLTTSTRTSLTVTYCKLQLNLQSLSSNNNEHKVKVHNI